MSDKSKISWTDASWPVTVGCDRVSPGCANCYAIRDANRMASNPNPKVSEVYSGLAVHDHDAGTFDWTGTVRCLPQRLDWPKRWQKPRKIFVCSQSDLFHQDVPDAFIVDVFRVMLENPRHIYQVLTKRPGRLADTATLRLKLKELFKQFTGSPQWPRHIWYGVSVESNDYRWRIGKAVLLNAPVTFISAEPLLEPLALLPGDGHYCLQDIAWIITGAESGPGRRPMNLDWVRSLRDQCQWGGVKFHFKQDILPDGTKIHLPELDGKIWDEFPVMSHIEGDLWLRQSKQGSG
jgi:protein gp37